MIFVCQIFTDYRVIKLPQIESSTDNLGCIFLIFSGFSLFLTLKKPKKGQDSGISYKQKLVSTKHATKLKPFNSIAYKIRILDACDFMHQYKSADISMAQV